MIRKAPRENLSPLEPSYWNLLENPIYKTSRTQEVGVKKAINLERLI
jgi:hypothetical protein